MDPSKPHGALIYPRNTKILQYEGRIETRHQLDERFGNEDFVTAPYAVELRNQLVEDASAYRSPAAIINHKPHSQANCRLMIQQNNRAAIMTTKNIFNGQELFADYGQEYNLDPEETSYRTVYK